MRNLVFVGLIGVVVGAASGYFIGLQVGQNKVSAISTESLPLPSISGVLGTVKSIKGNVISLKGGGGASPAASSTAWEISVGGRTEIFRQEWKDKGEFDKEVEIYKKKLFLLKPGSPAPTSTLIEPLPYNVNKIGLNDLRIGDKVSAEADRFIGTAETSFNARRIIVLAKDSQPGPSTAPSFTR